MTQKNHETGILGAYQPENAVLMKSGDGSVGMRYRDSEYTIGKDECIRERKMLIKGRRFIVASVFPKDAAYTPTDKMLALIDAEMEKDSKMG